MSNEDNFYTRIVELDEIYNFVVLSFFLFYNVKVLKKLYKISAP